MRKDILIFFGLQREIFGVCPWSGEFFRLSDCKIFLKARPPHDWMDKLVKKSDRLDAIEARIDEQEDELRERARERGRREALKIVKQIDRVFAPRRLNPDDAKVLFHPIDYVVFKGMKKENAIESIVLLDRETQSASFKGIQKSISKAVNNCNYEWLTLRVLNDGSVQEE